MTLFRVFLLICLVSIAGYSSVTIAHEGLSLFSVWFSDLGKMAWPGQFDMDFMTFLALSALWVSWRHHFQPVGLALGVVAFFGGMLFLSSYLLICSFRTRGNIAALMLGEARAAKL